MTRIVTLGSILLTASLLLATPALGHGAPDPRPYEVRLLHDYNDDWGGHSFAHDGHDMVALDLREAWSEALGAESLVFRFILSGGYNADATKPLLRDVLTFQAGGQERSYELTTGDNEVFGGTFDWIGAPQPVLRADGSQDGGRFTLEAAVLLSDLGLRVGDALGSFFVQGWAGEEKADHMVGGYTMNGVLVDDKPPTETAFPLSFERQSYKLQGATQYASLDVDVSSLAMKVGDERATLTLALANLLDLEQVASLDAVAPAGIGLEWHPAGGAVLGAQEEAIVHLYVTPGEDAAEGEVEIRLTTDLGGHVSLAVPLVVEAPAPPVDEQDGAHAHGDGAHDAMGDSMGDGSASGEPSPGDSGEKGILQNAPGAPLGLVVLALVGLAFVAARRRKA